MKIVDAVAADEIVLPDLLWVDEFTWSPVESSAEWALNGALHIQAGTNLKGRLLTFEAPDDEMGWVTRQVVLALQEKANLADRKLTLVLGSGATERQVPVRFRHWDGALEASPVYRWQQGAQTEWYKLVIRFIEVEA